MPSAIVSETRGANDAGHITDHDSIAALLNRLIAMQAASPAAGSTWQPDVGVSTAWVVQLPAGNITVGAVLATGFQVYPGMRLVLVIAQDATGGRVVTWSASFLNPVAPAAGPNAVTTLEFVNVATVAGAGNAQWRQVNAQVSTVPSGAAGGALAGTYPNPSLAASAVADANVAAGAAIAEAKLSLASDAIPTTPSRRSLGTGAQQAMPGNAAALSQFLAVTRWAPGTAATVVSNGATYVCIPSMTVTFTAPSSGNVLIRFRTFASITAIGAANQALYYALAPSSSVIGPFVVDANGGNQSLGTTLPAALATTTTPELTFYVDGLVAGTVYTYYLWAASTATTAANADVAIAQRTTYINIMTVQAAP